ncbi:MAG: hypothetical protein AABW68_04430 [archaeon]
MLYALRAHTPVSTIPRDIERVHLVRPISGKKLKTVLAHCPSILEVGASPSVEKRLGPDAREMLRKKGIPIVRAHRAGRALHMDLETIRTIVELRKDFLSMREIQKRTGVAKSTIHYLLKKAKRTKVKKGKHVIYVE